MRAGLSTIQQTLTPEASTILNQSIAEAARRNHGQTTPLHVAATLLASPSGFLRQACIRSHPNSSHPLQCRALELCFSVALERLPTAQSPSHEPPISNALMAALKRAQAHQRRGCPEQQQQPLLAVKVELEQLVISILDDPSVSRVMREASFSSPAVKATIEQSLNSGNSNNFSGSNNISSNGPYRMLCLSSGNKISTHHVSKNSTLNLGLGEEAKKVLEIMMRGKKKNPVLVGDARIEGIVREVLGKIEKHEIEVMKGVAVLSADGLKDKIGELGNMVENRIGGGGGVVVDLGDLKWLVEGVGGGGGGVVAETGRTAVAEVAKVVARFSGGKVWLIGTATCETYLRCQVYHSSMESDWDLQAVPITSRSPLSGIFPRVGSERVLSTPVESLNTLRSIPSPHPVLTRLVPENVDPGKKSALCPQCSNSYEKELAKLSALEKSFSESKQSLPQWLQNAKTTDEKQGNTDQGLLSKQKATELQKKWRDTCLHLHPSFHQNVRPDQRAGPGPGPLVLSMPGPFSTSLLSRPSLLPGLQTPKPLGDSLQLNMNPATAPKPVHHLTAAKPAGEAIQLNTSLRARVSSPVRTDLVLGSKAAPEPTSKNEDQAKDLLSCISSEPLQPKLLDKFSDTEAYKKLLKGLMETAWWQAEAASTLAAAVTRCRLGNGKLRSGGSSRGDAWLLFAGPDRVSKRKMALVLADQICGSNPITICLGARKDNEDVAARGKTASDRIADAVRRNPFSVIVLEDIDEADLLVRGGIKRAIERGRLTDSHGREVGLGNAVFVVTGDWSVADPEASKEERFLDEKKVASLAGGSWQLGLIVREKSGKRRGNWSQGDDRHCRSRTGSGLSLDLNLAVATSEIGDDDGGDGSSSHNSSSDISVDREDELGLMNRSFAVMSVPDDLLTSVDDSIVFKPVDAGFVRREIRKTVSVRFSSVVEDAELAIEVGDDVLEKIIGGLWHDRTSLEEWVDRVLTPGFEELKPRLPAGDRSGSVVRLVVESDTSSSRGKSLGNADWLPGTILV